MINQATYLFQNLILVYFLVINSLYTLLTILAFFEVREQQRRSYIDDYEYLHNSKLAPGISFLVPAYNEEKNIIESIYSYLNVRYPLYEVIVINDGSKDKTLENLIKAFDLKPKYHVFRKDLPTQKIRAYYRSKKDPRLVVIDKENGGKADALNAGINTARYPYLVGTDADVLMEDDAILRIMRPMLEDPVLNMASGGIVRIANGCTVENGEVTRVNLSRSSLPVFQVIEYLRAFNIGRVGFAKLNSLMIVSGAFGVFNTYAVRRAGGYNIEAIGEDMDLLVRMHRMLRENDKKYRFLYLAHPVCWTEAPQTLQVLGRQRNRWHRGNSQVVFSHIKMLFNPLYGTPGMIGMPYLFLFEFIGPLLEFFGYFYLLFLWISNRLNLQFFLAFLGVAVLWGMILSIMAILYEELYFKWYKKFSQLLRLLLYAFLENLGYRQITVIWRIWGTIDFLLGKKSWGAMHRTGYNKPK